MGSNHPVVVLLDALLRLVVLVVLGRQGGRLLCSSVVLVVAEEFFDAGSRRWRPLKSRASLAFCWFSEAKMSTGMKVHVFNERKMSQSSDGDFDLR